MRNYDYYEPKCNHGSSLSPAIHSIMSAELRKPETYEFFRCAAYMDISDFKHNTSGGLHLACLGGVWMSVVNGYLGMRHYKDGILFNPHIPTEWTGYHLKFVYRGAMLEISVNQDKTIFTLVEGDSMEFAVREKQVKLNSENKVYQVSMK